MKVNYSGKLYVIHWQHERFGTVTRYGERSIDTKGGVTHCLIRERRIETNTYAHNITEGMAECSKRDTYYKATGRKISLTKALEGCGNREFRKAVWDQYRKECRA